ncbi:hypothetical protein FHG87_010419 [Trinorchestia longiramus]|nr:hypothetical protein FHG87_010419 [Trinorchestia longiramus]
MPVFRGAYYCNRNAVIASPTGKVRVVHELGKRLHCVVAAFAVALAQFRTCSTASLTSGVPNMSAASSPESECLYQGRPEGAVRKCHRLSSRADYLEQCDKLEEALGCHQQSSQALQAYLRTQISVSTRRQVELLIHRHQNRILYLKRRMEEGRQQGAGPGDMSASMTEASDEHVRLYYCQNPVMLQDMKRSQVQFNNAMEQLHRLAQPEDVTREVQNCSLFNTDEETISPDSSSQDSPLGPNTCGKQEGCEPRSSTCDEGSKSCCTPCVPCTSLDTRSESSNDSKTCCRNSPCSTPCQSGPHSLKHCDPEFKTSPQSCAERLCHGCNKTGASGVVCRQCKKSLETRVNEEGSLVRLVSELPMLWRAKDRMIHSVLADYCRVAKARNELQQQTQHLTMQLERARQQLQQFSSSINSNYADHDGELSAHDTSANSSDQRRHAAALSDELLCDALERNFRIKGQQHYGATDTLRKTNATSQFGSLVKHEFLDSDDKVKQCTSKSIGITDGLVGVPFMHSNYPGDKGCSTSFIPCNSDLQHTQKFNK